MSMVHCRGCGHSIHESAPKCPKCGFVQQGAAAAAAPGPTRQPGGRLGIALGMAGAGLFVMVLLAGLFHEGGGSEGDTATTVAATPAAQAASPTRAPTPAPAPATAQRQVMSDEDAEDLAARSIIAAVQASPKGICAGVAPFMEQAWAMYRQTGSPGYQRNFFAAVENAERRGCL